MRWLVTAEHCSGRSVGHPCLKGVYSDPTDGFDEIIEADSEESAIDLGMTALEQLVEEANSCDCERQLSPGGEQWWDSVALHAEFLDD